MITSNCYDISTKLLEMKAWLMKLLNVEEVPSIDNTIISINNLLNESIFNKTENDYFNEISKPEYSKDRQRIYDSFILVDIYSLFSLIPSHKIPRAKLTKILDLKNISEESKRNDLIEEARNILFELEFASFLNKCGFEIIDFDDITIQYYGQKINFQCKRLHSTNPKTVLNNILSAKNQFVKRSDCSMGIVVLGAENLLKNAEFYNEQHDFYYQKSDSILINSRNLDTITNVTKNAQNIFFKTYLSQFIDQITDISSLFLIFRFNSINFSKRGIINFININNVDFSIKNIVDGKYHQSIIKKLINKFKQKYC